jgi:ketosteroid isomerase-like protein
MFPRRLFAVAAALLLSSFATFAQSANEQKLIKMTDDLAAAFASNDAATLDKVLTDDFVKTAASVNRAQPKAQFVGGLRSGRQKYLSYQLSNEKVQAYENSGVVTANADFNVINGSNPPAENHEVVTAIWVQQQGNWRCAAWISWKNLPAGPPPAPASSN